MSDDDIQTYDGKWESLSIRFNRITKLKSEYIQSMLDAFEENPIVDVRELKGPRRTPNDIKKYHQEYYQKRKAERKKLEEQNEQAEQAE